MFECYWYREKLHVWIRFITYLFEVIFCLHIFVSHCIRIYIFLSDTYVIVFFPWKWKIILYLHSHHWMNVIISVMNKILFLCKLGCLVKSCKWVATFYFPSCNVSYTGGPYNHDKAKSWRLAAYPFRKNTRLEFESIKKCWHSTRPLKLVFSCISSVKVKPFSVLTQDT